MATIIKSGDQDDDDDDQSHKKNSINRPKIIKKLISIFKNDERPEKQKKIGQKKREYFFQPPFYLIYIRIEIVVNEKMKNKIKTETGQCESIIIIIIIIN